MVLKIISFFFLPFLMIALFLSSIGVQQVTLDNNFYGFIQQVNSRMSSWGDWGFIPTIPPIPTFATSGADWFLVLNVLINLVNGLSSIINAIITFANFGWRVVEWTISFLSVLLEGLNWLGRPL